jgi:hypothetical protein
VLEKVHHGAAGRIPINGKNDIISDFFVDNMRQMLLRTNELNLPKHPTPI